MSSLWSTVALGAFAGGFALVAWRSLFPPPVPLDAALRRLQPAPAPVSDGAGPAWKRSLGRRVEPTLSDLGLCGDRVQSDARIVGADLDVHVGSKVVCALLPPGFVGASALLLGMAGVEVPMPVLVLSVLAGAGCGFVAPDLSLRAQAERRRREFRTAFGAYLDLVAVSLAGGTGTEAALVEAARIGDSWAFRLLRRATDAARIESGSLWQSIAELGDDLRVPVLGELAASVALAGSEGAKVRASIAVKADTLRAGALAEAEAEAQASTERMVVPTAMLLFGFVLLIGFPAVMTVVGGL